MYFLSLLNTRETLFSLDEKVVDQDMCQEALGNFVKSFENVMDLYSRVSKDVHL